MSNNEDRFGQIFSN